jgi:transcription antitermination factor NusG
VSDWYLVRTATRQEKRAVASLEEAAFEVYCPVEVRWERIGVRKMREKRERAYFPGYLFCRIGDGQFAAVESVDAVHAIVRYTTSSGERAPLKVPEGVVALVAKQDEAGEFDATRQDRPEMEFGAEVHVKAGPFVGLIGKVNSMRGPDRVRVLLDAIQRGAPVVPIELKVADIELVA